MNNYVEQAINALPPFLGLGSFVPLRKAFDYEGFDAQGVRRAEDLPPYLIFGSLSTHHFEVSATGWRCRWQGDSEDSFFQLQYDRGQRLISISDRWRGIDGGLAVCPSGMDLRRAIAQVRYSRFPQVWDAAAVTETQDRYRIHYISSEHSGSSVSSGVPDGLMLMICIPLGIGDLRSFIYSFQTVQRTQNFAFPSFGYIRRCVGVVNYVTGLNPRWAEDAAELMFKTIETAGFVPPAMPTLETAADGASAMTVRRILYLAFVQVPLAGLLPSLAWLKSAGWVAQKSQGDPAETPKFGIEFTSFIAPSLLEFEAPYVSLWDDAGCRRATWIMPEDKQAAISDLAQSVNMPVEHALGLAKKAEEIGLDLLNQLRRGPSP